MDTALFLAGVFMVLGCVWAWMLAGLRLASGQSLIPAETRRAVPWGPVEIIVTVLILVMLQGFLASAARIAFRAGLETPADTLPADVRAACFLAAALGSLLTLALSIIAVRLRTGATWHDLGFAPHQIYRDLRLGGVAFVMIAPPVYFIQYLLVQWFPSEHPLAEFLKEHPNGAFLAVCGFSAVFVAPLAEEYFFRVLVQGWLERLAGVAGNHSDNGTLGDEPLAMELSGDLHRDLSNPYAAPLTDLEVPKSAAPNIADQRPGAVPLKIWPMAASSLFFAVMHWQHGPDPIPLFLFAMGLGYLYQRTHRIWPGIVLHFSLNASSMVLLLVGIRG